MDIKIEPCDKSSLNILEIEYDGTAQHNIKNAVQSSSDQYDVRIKLEGNQYDEIEEQNLLATPVSDPLTAGSSCSPDPPEPQKTSFFYEIQIDQHDTKSTISEELVAAIILDRFIFHNRNFVCSFCFKVFPSNHTLKVHKKDDHNCLRFRLNKHDNKSIQFDKELSYKCDICSYKCAKPSYLRRHQIKHTREKDFKCNVCDFVTGYWENLKRHSVNHAEVKPFKCKRCDYSTSTLAYLNTHILRHTGERPFKCNQCNFKCGSLYNLKDHKKTHSGEKPYRCDECDYRSLRSNDVQRHKVIHDVVKNILKCNECSFKCNTYKKLNKHKIKHTTLKI